MASAWAPGEPANPRMAHRHLAAQIDPIGTISVEIQHESASAHSGGYRVERQAQYVTVRDGTRYPFTRLSKLFVPGTSLRTLASCHWICQ